MSSNSRPETACFPAAVKAQTVLCALLLANGLPTSAQTAQTVPPEPPQAISASEARPTLRMALDAAWARSLDGRTQADRRSELQARQAASGSWISASPSVLLANRSDRLNTNAGFSEWEAEAAFPMQWPKARNANLAALQTEADGFEINNRASRLQIAGEVREAAWVTLLAQLELDAAQRRHVDAAALAADVERRVKAGDLARIDLNAARDSEQQALSALARAEGETQRTRRLWRTMTGFAQLPADLYGISSPVFDTEQHPALQARQAAVALARARLSQANATARDAPELTFGITRERDVQGAAARNTARVGIKIPLVLGSLQQPRLTGAQSEIARAEAELALEREHLTAALADTQMALTQSRRIELIAAERARLVEDSFGLIEKSFRLGQIDLPARLRVQAERFDADLSLARARLETGRALSRLQQAQGLIP